MRGFVLLLGQLDSLQVLDPTKTLGKTGGMLMRDILLIAGAVAVLSFVLILWATNTVRRSKRRRRHRSGSEPTSSQPTAVSARRTEHRHHQRRRLRREHRRRNPTLQETGGLPPARSESTSTPPS